AFIESAVKAGIAPIEDFNGGSHEGVSFLQYTIRDGKRESTAAAFIKPIRARANLTIEVEAQADRILFEGKRAVGLAYRVAGQPCEVKAREIILSAGVI
ncbi:GMC family oxidoreductase N-terminal domain-containing protein, partial [Mycobacterium tuberculosis]